MTNAEFAERDQEFRAACVKAGIPPTRRQASKWRLKDGLAYHLWNHRNGDGAIDENRILMAKE